MNRHGWLAALVVGAAACGDPQAPADSVSPGAGSSGAAESAVATSADVRLDRARSALRAADVAHSASSSTVPAGFIEHLADDAVFLWPNAPYTVGKEAIAAVLSAPPPPFVPGITLSWTPVFADVSVDGKVGYTFGNVQITRPGLATLPGQYVAFWRKHQGVWQVEAWNLSPAFAPPAPLPDDFGEALIASGGGTFQPVSQRQETRRLMDVDATFSRASVRLGQAEAFGRYAHRHAIVLAGGNPDFFIGREQIVESRQGAQGTLSWTPVMGGVGPLGDLGWSMGTYVVSLGEQTGYGKYLSVWRKGPRGGWKFVQDAGSGNPTPAL